MWERSEALRLLRGGAIFLVSIVLILAIGEVTARLLFPEQVIDACIGPQGKVTHNCSGRFKLPEGPWVTHAYNDCGFRSPTSCAPLPANRPRLVILGTSVSTGYGLPQAQTLGAQTAVRLSRACRQSVDYQNMPLYLPLGPGPDYWNGLDAKINATMALKPTALIFTISSWDLGHYDPAPQSPTLAARKVKPRLLQRLVGKMTGLVEQSRLILAVRNLAYRDPHTFLRLYLNAEDQTGYLRSTYTPAWEARIDVLDQIVARFANASQEKGVEMFLAYTPFAASPVMLAKNIKFDGVDPLALDRRVVAIAARHGLRTVELTRTLARQPDPLGLYLPVNGHPNALGDAVIGQAIASALNPDPASARCLGVSPAEHPHAIRSEGPTPPSPGAAAPLR